MIEADLCVSNELTPSSVPRLHRRKKAAREEAETC